MNLEEVEARIKELLCDNLGIDPDQLDYDTELFGELIDLDSIDSLTIIALIDEEYEVDMTGVGKEPFQTVESLANFVCEHKEAAE